MKEQHRAAGQPDVLPDLLFRVARQKLESYIPIGLDEAMVASQFGV